MSITVTRLRARTALLLVLALGLTIAPLSAVTPLAHADSGMESSFVSALNAERTSRGLPALSTNGSLTSVARSWSGTMADQGRLYHNPNLGSQVSGWQKVGENVGRGPSVNSIHAALMNSPGHRANILDNDWTEVGVGVVVKDGTVWVTQVFRRPAGASSPPPQEQPEEAPQQGSSSSGSAGSSGSSGSSGSAGSSGSSGSPGSAGSSGSSGSSGSAGSSGGGAASSPAPPPPPEPDPEPEPHEVAERPLPMDRVTLTLGRLQAADLAMKLDEVLASD